MSETRAAGAATLAEGFYPRQRHADSGGGAERVSEAHPRAAALKTAKGRPVSPQLVSLKEIARLWGCHRSTASRILARHGIRPLIFGSGKTAMRRYIRADVIKLMKKLVKQSGGRPFLE